MSFEEVEAKFNSVWKQMEDFIPMGSKEEAKRIKRKGLSLKQESTKKQKASEEVTEEAKSSDEVPKEKVKEMMQLVPIEEVYVEALQVKHPIIDWKVYTEGQRSYWKITRLGGSSASYQFFIDLLKHLDREDLNQLWRLVVEELLMIKDIDEIIPYLGGKSRGHDRISDKDAIILYFLANRVEIDFARNPSVLVDKTKSARDGLKTGHTDLVDEPIILLDESDEEETQIHKDTQATSYDEPKDTSVPPHPSLKSIQLQELLAHVNLLQSQKDMLEQQKEKAKAEVAFLKARPLYLDINQLTELLFAELKTIQWELPAEFLVLPNQISSVQEKLKTLDALPNLLNKVTATLNRFSTIMENASSGATSASVPSTGIADASPTEEEKNTNPTEDADLTNLKNN
uniref:Uncharacterized protein n=1 Tax=Tanacetum cinerariifolium TaxID=118510 RepID=A0A6L2K6V7_TANCI|nr:hypothetical protein [Tanacetum cinerariifolium]